MFLLCEDDLEVEYFVQQLLLLTSTPGTNMPTSMLLEWSRKKASTEWSDKLIEVLCVASCKHVLLNLGLNIDKLDLFYFPKRPEISTHIHHLTKLLYLMCEKLRLDECAQLMEVIKERYPREFSKIHVESSHLEVFLLLCISRKILKVFQSPPDLGILIETFKAVDNLDLYDFVKSNLERLPMIARSSNLTQDKECKASTSTSTIRDTPQTQTAVKIVDISNTVYEVNRDRPGVLLIINQNKFYMETDPNLSYMLPQKPLEERMGTEKDVAALQRTFNQFNYDIIIRNDLTHLEIIDEIRTTIETMTKSTSSLFVAILSHGLEGCVFGSNSIPLEVREIKNQIYKCGDHLLIGRPKCLIVQACQGQDLQISKLIAANELQTDSPNANPGTVAIPPCSDFLIAWSTVEGFASLRHKRTGTWFIQTLCEEIDHFYES